MCLGSLRRFPGLALVVIVSLCLLSITATTPAVHHSVLCVIAIMGDLASPPGRRRNSPDLHRVQLCERKQGHALGDHRNVPRDCQTTELHDAPVHTRRVAKRRWRLVTTHFEISRTEAYEFSLTVAGSSSGSVCIGPDRAGCVCPMRLRALGQHKT